MKLGDLINFVDFLHHFLESHILFREINVGDKVDSEFLQLLEGLFIELSVFTLTRCQ